jgi:hypothetical protein
MKDQQVGDQMVVFDELALLVTDGLVRQRAATFKAAAQEQRITVATRSRYKEFLRLPNPATATEPF